MDHVEVDYKEIDIEVFRMDFEQRLRFADVFQKIHTGNPQWFTMRFLDNLDKKAGEVSIRTLSMEVNSDGNIDIHAIPDALEDPVELTDDELAVMDKTGTLWAADFPNIIAYLLEDTNDETDSEDNLTSRKRLPVLA